MSNLRKAIVLVVSLAFVLVAPLAVSTPAAAATVSYTLFAGRGPGSPAGTGWSFNNTTLTSPGPALSANVGDTVVLTLNATDGRFHSWYIDYNNNSAWNPGTPDNESGTDFPNATTGDAVTWSFVPSTNGTFYYRSSHGGDGALWGIITIAPAVGGVIPGVDNSVLIVAGAVVIVVAVLAVAALFWRRMKTPPAPPPPES